MTSQVKFSTYHQAASREIEKELEKFSQHMNKKVAEDFPELKKLSEKFTKRFLGGKMLRGTLVKLGYELVTKPNMEIIKPAAAFEILHTSLLIHDDIIDQSPTRRGKSALHVHKEKHYGISQAICLGDLGIVQANKLIAQSNFLPDRKNKAVIYFSTVISDTILGEMLDVASAQTLKRTEKQILAIHNMKTAQYTFVGPLTIGAILGGASDDLLQAIKLFGELLGTAFQIHDDIMGVFGDETIIGKSTTSDIEENKSTLLITYALEHGNRQQQKILKTHYGQKKITKTQQEKIKEIFQVTGALIYSQNKIKKLTEQATPFIPHLTKNKISQKLLFDFANYLLAREK
jgi:geranylgeranyl diphosphate synthase, type I